ncbi:hypothetical protein VDG1235_4704 [Verrucomicrobiia bacterium DG1235]|nr:hypothetical protein VDG1235_4704 [Verrucomicrobiae bacterium DG1235]
MAIESPTQTKYKKDTMLRVLVFGNSGSGKSTLAQRLAGLTEIGHLDLDDVAWKPGHPGVRQSLHTSFEAIDAFIEANPQWVIEGCYTSLLDYAAENANEIIFLNPGIEICQQNCRSRPWEPHKYASKTAQDKNLQMLLNWVADYQTRDDEFSLQEHLLFYNSFDGAKSELRSNEEILAKAKEITNRNRSIKS